MRRAEAAVARSPVGTEGAVTSASVVPDTGAETAERLPAPSYAATP